MSMKLYVGNLSYSMNENGLKDLFAEFGDVVSAKIITDKFTNKSKGFGFVEMATKDAASAAIGALDGKDVSGRTLRVNEARERETTRAPRMNNRY